MIKLKLIFFLVALNSISLFAQVPPETTEAPIDNSIKGQFENLYSKSNNYKEFKVIKRTWITTLKKNTLDSLQNLERKLKTAESEIIDQQKKIESSKVSFNSVNKQLLDVTKQKDAMHFLGFDLTKQSYNTLVWSIVFILLILLLLFIYKFRNSNIITQNANTNLKDLEQEFEDYRRKAIEREQKVMRKLQDELNKQK